jgi:hypothetical protein
LARLDQFTGQPVRINDLDSPLGKKGRNRALAAADAPS